MTQDASSAPRANNIASMDSYWMPFTANRRFKADPILFDSASGMSFRTTDGREVLDGTAGMWCVNAGHGRDEIADAVAAQIRRLDYAPPFQIGNPLVFAYAERLAAYAPGADDTKLDRIFFTGSGSESVETALKIALAYQQAVGQPKRERLVGRERAYHGVNFGGISVGGLVNNRRAFALLPGIDHIRHTHDLARNAFSVGVPAHGAELADDLERLVALHGAGSIAAVIVEPVAGAGGVLPPPQGYLQRLREITSRHGILLIFDEVITGFGRLGAPFASDYFGVVPDIMACAKGMTNACVPMGGVFVSRAVHDAVINATAEGVEFFHGYTFSGSPAGCAAGMAALDIYEREGLFSSASIRANAWNLAIHGLRRPGIIDIRTIGYLAALDIDPAFENAGPALFRACLENGLLIRPIGNTIALSPPLIATEDDIARITEILGGALRAVLG